MLVYYFYKNEPLNLEDVEELAEFNRVYSAEMERQKTKKKLSYIRNNKSLISSTAINGIA
jgi:hypothetical protein